MDARRLLGLYASETQDYLRLLQRSLLALERAAGSEAGRSALDEAFRATHTLKGISSAMGFTEAARGAHQLEDRLDALRSGRPGAGDFDALLAEADLLEAAITAALDDAAPSHPFADGGTADPEAGPAPAAALRAAAPAGTAVVVVVTLRDDAPARAARALLVLRALEARDDVLGSWPETPGDDFDGVLAIFLGSRRDLAAADAAIRGVGDVAFVDVVAADGAAVAGGGPGSAPVPGAVPLRRQLRVDAERLDGLAGAIGELSILFGRVAGDGRVRGAAGEVVDRMGMLLGRLQQDVVDLRMVPVGGAFERLPRVVRDAARHLGRDVELELSGEDVRLDRVLVEELAEPLVHLLRNAVDHGIEPPAERAAAGKPGRGRVSVHAERIRGNVEVTVSDDGRGVAAGHVMRRARAAGLVAESAGDDLADDEVLRLLSHPGVSTATSVGEVSGRGVGLDAVISRVRAMGGAVELKTQAGAGTTFTLRLPATLALAQALRVRVGGEEYAIPVTHVVEAVDLEADSARPGAEPVLRLRDEALPLVRLHAMLQVTGEPAERAAVIAGSGARRTALAVDEVVGREQVLVRPFDAAAGTLPYFSGATLGADGRPVLVIDPLSVL